MKSIVCFPTVKQSETYQLMLNRTLGILKPLMIAKEGLFDQSDILLLETICNNEPQSGFHDLSIKCQFYQVLLNKLYEKTFTDLSHSTQVLIELLFNPSLENAMLMNFEIENFDKMLSMYLTNIAFFIDDENFPNDIGSLWLAGENLPFAIMKNAINKYLIWYEKYENFSKKNENVIDPTLYPVLLEKLSDLILTDKDGEFKVYNVEMDNTTTKVLAENDFLGTSGLFPCVAIIKIDQNSVTVTHSFDEHELSMQDAEKTLGNNKDVYLIGGQAYNMSSFLDIITSNKYLITDVQLLNPAYSSMDAICMRYKNEHIIACLTHPVPNQLTFDANFESYSSSANSEEELSTSKHSDGDTSIESQDRFFKAESKKRKLEGADLQENKKQKTEIIPN